MLRLIFPSVLVVCLAGLAGCGDGDSSSPEGIAIDAPSTSPSTGRASDEAADEAANGASDGSTSTTRGTTQETDQRSADVRETLSGTWLAEDVSAPVGDVKIRLRFREDGPVRLIAISELPFGGEVKDTESPYHVEDGKIIAPEIGDGVSMPYYFEDDRLVLEYKPGQTVRLRKVEEEDPAGE